MRIALISDITPVPLMAGPLVLHRHFTAMPQHPLLVVSGSIDQPDPEPRHWQVLRLPRCLRSLRRPRLLPVFEEVASRVHLHRFRATVDAFRPDLVLSVWSREFLLPAAAYARRSGLPLVLLCHDDLETLLPGGRLARHWAKRRYGEVYRQACARLCVSSPMEQELRRRHGVPGVVLAPIPEPPGSELEAQPPMPSRGSGAPDAAPGLRLGAIGMTARTEPGPWLALADALHRIGGELDLCGPGLPDALARHPAVCWQGFLPDALSLKKHYTRSADAMVVMQGFGPGEQGPARTNFPSKLIEVLQYGLPLALFAPAGSSLASWAAERSLPCADRVDAPTLEREMRELADPRLRAGRSARFATVASSEYSHAALQRRFEELLQASVRHSP